MGVLKIKRVCGFSISSIHFSMMILPYINKELKKEKNIITLLEVNLEKNIKEIISKITLNNEAKEEILNINWKRTDINKVSIEKRFNLAKEKDLCIIVYGSETYINNVNIILNKYFEKKDKIYQNKKIKIVDCYTVNDFNENIREILDGHDKIFNTSGEHNIEEIFENYYLA